MNYLPDGYHEEIGYFNIIVDPMENIYHVHKYRELSSHGDVDHIFLVWDRDGLICTDCAQTFPSLKTMRTVQALKDLKK